MPSSTGVDAVTGKPLTDWEHTRQSIDKILTTSIGSRVMRRDFGSELPDLVDTKMTQRQILRLYSAAAVALQKWEPRFAMQRGSVTRADALGSITLDLYGVYYPFGHRGNFSVMDDARTQVVIVGNSL